MKELDKLPKPYSSTSHRYDYDKLFDGKPYELTEGEDFHVVPKNVVKAIKRVAKSRGVKVCCFHMDGKVYVQREAPEPMKSYPFDHEYARELSEGNKTLEPYVN